jgi:hypothetical protein
LLVTVFIGFLFLEESLLQEAIAKTSAKIKNDYNSTFTVKEASFNGLSGISVYRI